MNRLAIAKSIDAKTFRYQTECKMGFFSMDFNYFGNHSMITTVGGIRLAFKSGLATEQATEYAQNGHMATKRGDGMNKLDIPLLFQK